MSLVLVTGGAGFIGSHVCEALLARGDSVVALDNFDDFYDAGIKRRNLSAAMARPDFKIVEGDIRDRKAVASVFGLQPDAVIHLAARAGVRPSIQDPLLYQDVNIHGTTVLLEACRTRPSTRFVFASSSSVYGNRTTVPFRESDRVDDPISPYAATKKSGELICHAYHHLFGIPTTCLRFFTVYGPRQRPDLAIHKFAQLIDNGLPVPVFGDGTMERDFTYISDIVDGVLRALDRCRAYRIYNLGEERPVSVNMLVGVLEEALRKTALVRHEPLQPGDVQRTFADVSLARTELGYAPKTDFRAGIARFVEWFRQAKPH